jgi:hypothetical protein
LHIAEHFSLRVLSEKAAHTVFALPLRSRQALEPFIAKTVRGAGKRTITRATIDGVAAGRPVIVLEREFPQVLGETFRKNAQGNAERVAECRILRVIYDWTGRPVTVYPVETFLHIPGM